MPECHLSPLPAHLPTTHHLPSTIHHTLPPPPLIFPLDPTRSDRFYFESPHSLWLSSIFGLVFEYSISSLSPLLDGPDELMYLTEVPTHTPPPHSMLRHTTPPRHTTPSHATPYHATPRHTTSRHATPNRATPRHAITPHRMPRYTVPRHPFSRHPFPHHPLLPPHPIPVSLTYPACTLHPSPQVPRNRPCPPLHLLDAAFIFLTITVVQQINDLHTRFCGGCGTARPDPATCAMKCSACGGMIAEGANFCGGCVTYGLKHGSF